VKRSDSFPPLSEQNFTDDRAMMLTKMNERKKAMRYKLTLKGDWPDLKKKLQIRFPGLVTDDLEDRDDAKAIVLDRLGSQLQKTRQEITRILNRY
jgi:hypothetical protein